MSAIIQGVGRTCEWPYGGENWFWRRQTQDQSYKDQGGFWKFRAEAPSHFHHVWEFPPHGDDSAVVQQLEAKPTAGVECSPPAWKCPSGKQAGVGPALLQGPH